MLRCRRRLLVSVALVSTAITSARYRCVDDPEGRGVACDARLCRDGRVDPAVYYAWSISGRQGRLRASSATPRCWPRRGIDALQFITPQGSVASNVDGTPSREARRRNLWVQVIPTDEGDDVATLLTSIHRRDIGERAERDDVPFAGEVR